MRWVHIVLVAFFFLVVPHASADAASCTPPMTYPALPREEYGAPYSFVTPGYPLLLKASSCGDTITVTAGNDTSFTFPQVHVVSKGKRATLMLSSTSPLVNGWIAGSGTITIPAADDLSILAYICESSTSGFKCGCRDHACEGGRWTIARLTDAPKRSSDGRARFATTPASSSHERWLMGYYPSWDRDRLPVRDIAWEHLTHIAIGPVTPRADGGLVTNLDMEGDSGQTFAIEAAREAKRHGVTPMLFVGGGAEGALGWRGATEEKNVDIFAQTLVSTMDAWGFSGIDIDWEPLGPADYPGLLRLTNALRARKPAIPLSLAVPHINVNKRTDLSVFASLALHYNQINIMTYDMAGVWSGWDLWHHSPLFGETSTTPTSIESSVARYVEAGVPKQKLGIGAPFYGYCVTGPRKPRESLASAASKGAMSYRLIMREYRGEGHIRYDSSAAASYLMFDRPTGRDSCTFITYMEAKDARVRGEWVREQGLGGAIAWSLGQQHMDEERASARHPLLKALASGLF